MPSLSSARRTKRRISASSSTISKRGLASLMGDIVGRGRFVERRRRWRLAARQPQRETRAAAVTCRRGPAVAREGAAVRLRDGAADRQAQADARRRTFLLAALELLEQLLLAALGQTRPMVVDPQLDGLAGSARAD